MKRIWDDVEITPRPLSFGLHNLPCVRVVVAAAAVVVVVAAAVVVVVVVVFVVYSNPDVFE